MARRSFVVVTSDHILIRKGELCQMHEMHSAGWYASKIISELPKHIFKPAPERLLIGVIYLALGLGAMSLIGFYDLSWFANLGLSLLVATAFAGMGFLGHEILHGTVIKNPMLRDLFGGIAFLQFNLGPKLWRKWHNAEHHAHTQDLLEHTDPDAMSTMEAFFERPALQFIYRLPPWVRSAITFGSFLGFFSVFSFLMLKRYHREFPVRERIIVYLQFIGPAVMWFSLLFVFGPAKWFFIYVLPLMLANFVVIAYISTNHQLNPLTEVNDPLANSLSVTVPRWMDVLHLNFSHHVEHHLFPGMNPKYAPLVKEQLRKKFADRYHDMPFSQALLTLWRTPRLYKDGKDLVDPHRGLTYGSLGNGLDPNRVRANPLEQ